MALGSKGATMSTSRDAVRKAVTMPAKDRRRQGRSPKANDPLAIADQVRRDTSPGLDPERRSLLGQFLTPAPVARFMASMFVGRKSDVRVLDPGAGVGSLSAALVSALCQAPRRPRSISLTTYEVDPLLSRRLGDVLEQCRRRCQNAGVRFEARIIEADFLEEGVEGLAGGLFAHSTHDLFDYAILNPPYRKISTDSRERRLLRKLGLETTNLYTGFLGVTARLLAPGGEMVAITPRSFCNGTYFEPFRRFFLRDMRFQRIHVFDSRDQAFAEDEVLQENVVFRATRTTASRDMVCISSSAGPDEVDMRMRKIRHEEIVRPDDPHVFVHIVPDPDGEVVRRQVEGLGSSLADLGLTVSTGRVVDFRARDLLQSSPDANSAPLIYPCHLKGGLVEWPNGQTRKPNALALRPGVDELLVPTGHYVLVKRFSAKEEPRRVTAAVFDPTVVRAERVGFENHLNYYHLRGGGLPVNVAKGLMAFLNSTLVDTYFRQFSGHTQVNAADLRSLRYPLKTQLVELGRRVGKGLPAQVALDELVHEVVVDA